MRVCFQINWSEKIGLIPIHYNKIPPDPLSLVVWRCKNTSYLIIITSSDWEIRPKSVARALWERDRDIKGNNLTVCHWLRKLTPSLNATLPDLIWRVKFIIEDGSRQIRRGQVHTQRSEHMHACRRTYKAVGCFESVLNAAITKARHESRNSSASKNTHNPLARSAAPSCLINVRSDTNRCWSFHYFMPRAHSLNGK